MKCLEALRISTEQPLPLILGRNIQKHTAIIQCPQCGMAAVGAFHKGRQRGIRFLLWQKTVGMAVIGEIADFPSRAERLQNLRPETLNPDMSARLCHALRCSLRKRQVKIVHVNHIARQNTLQSLRQCWLSGSTAPVERKQKSASRMRGQQIKKTRKIIHWQCAHRRRRQTNRLSPFDVAQA